MLLKFNLLVCRTAQFLSVARRMFKISNKSVKKQAVDTDLTLVSGPTAQFLSEQ